MSQAPLPTTSLPAAIARAIEEVKLDDRWTLKSGRTYMNGSHALLRLMMLQRQIDEAAGLNTAGFLSGYRGSARLIKTRGNQKSILRPRTLNSCPA
jgi:lipopolysaccharide assembly outer membrane protein LptD (OstA)